MFRPWDSLLFRGKTQKRSFLIRLCRFFIAQLIFVCCLLQIERVKSERESREREKYGSSWRWWHRECWIGESSSTHLHSRLRHRYFAPLSTEPINRFLLLCLILIAAMQAEAQPLVNKFGLSETSDSPLRPHSSWFSTNLLIKPKSLSFWASCFMCRLGKGLPWVLYHGLHKDLRIYVVCPGKDAASGMFLLFASFHYSHRDL